MEKKQHRIGCVLHGVRAAVAFAHAAGGTEGAGRQVLPGLQICFMIIIFARPIGYF